MKTDNIKISPQWNKSKEQIWSEVFADLEETSARIAKENNIPSKRIAKENNIPSERIGSGKRDFVEESSDNFDKRRNAQLQKIDHKKRSFVFRRKALTYATAAIVTVLVALPSAAFFHTKQVMTKRGEHSSATLPDGSTVTLNAESSISYKPYWWMVSRQVSMSGEAYFEVAKGEKFTVLSASGKVSVMGTSFNVLDRADSYDVTCLTGKVSVVSFGQIIVLTPGMEARLNDGKLSEFTYINNNPTSVGWINGMFSFTDTPISKVIEEVERQYDIKIKTPKNIDYIYTGNFTKSESPEQVLDIISKPFGIELSIEK